MAIANAYTRAIETNDWRAIAKIWSPRITMWNNFLLREIGFGEALGMQKSMHSRVRDIRITGIRREKTETGYFHQAVFNGTTASGVTFSSPYCFLAILDDDGLIVREDEYLTTHLLDWLQAGVEAFGSAPSGNNLS